MNDSLKIVTIAILSAAVLFSVYLIIKTQLSRLGRTPGAAASPLVTYFGEKISGFIVLGIIPWFLFVKILSLTPGEVGLVTGKSAEYWYLLAAMLAVVSILTYFVSGRETMWERYPQLSQKVWTLKYSVLSLSGWFLYILGYEFLFRGILWSVCYDQLGFYPALSINLGLYALAHLDQGPGMTIGSIPAGIVLCLFSMVTGSFIFSFLIHFWMAANNELFCIFRNPDIRFRIFEGRSEI